MHSIHLAVITSGAFECQAIYLIIFLEGSPDLIIDRLASEYDFR
jgi:hypothetical protein